MSANLPDGQQEEDFHYNNSINSDLTINYSKELFEGFSVNYGSEILKFFPSDRIMDRLETYWFSGIGQGNWGSYI